MRTQEYDDLTDDGRAAAHRSRATAMLPEIAGQVRGALAEQALDLTLFFLVPHTGDSIISFGTSGDPSDPEWEQVCGIVSSIVRMSIGLDRTRCREIACASTTDLITDRRHSPVQSDIQSSADHRFRLPPSHPHLATITIDPVDWCRFQQLNDDNPATRIMTHDDPVDGMMTVFVACASTSVRDRLLDGWD